MKDFEAGLLLITLERAAVSSTLGYFARSTNLWESPLGKHEHNDSEYVLECNSCDKELCCLTLLDTRTFNQHPLWKIGVR
jgi:hypothetical protein